MLKVNNGLWVISDTHFGHKNIGKYGGRPDDHETKMLYEWTKLVRPQDQILHLGDVVFANYPKWKVLIRHLPGEKFLIKGNHDKQMDPYYVDCGFTIVSPFVHKNHAFTHQPASTMFPPPIGNWITNIHGHIHNNGYHEDLEGELFPSKNYINMCVEMTDLKPVQLGQIWDAV